MAPFYSASGNEIDFAVKQLFELFFNLYMFEQTTLGVVAKCNEDVYIAGRTKIFS